jgi:hypothetical protein
MEEADSPSIRPAERLALEACDREESRGGEVEMIENLQSAAVQELAEQSAEVLTRSGNGIGEFETVLQRLQESSVFTQLVPQPAVTEVEIDPIQQPALDAVADPGGLEMLLADLQSNHAELNHLVEGMEGRTYSSAELLGLQKRMNELTLTLEMGTKLASQAVENLNRVLTQQI